jgi:hypothetical protein
MTVSRRTLAVVAGMLVLVGGGFVWRSCTESDETKIVNTIQAGREAIENKSVRGVMAVISPMYHDNVGLNYDGAHRMLQRLFLGVEAIRVDLSALSRPVFDRSVADHVATVTVNVVVSGTWQGQALYLMGTPGQPVSLTLTMTKEGRRWLVREVGGLQLPALESSLKSPHINDHRAV